MPELFLKLNELIEAGKKNSATELQYGINEIISKMCSEGQIPFDLCTM